MEFMGLVYLFAWMVDIVVHVGKYSVHEIRWVYGWIWLVKLNPGVCKGLRIRVFFLLQQVFFCLAVLGGTDETWVFVRVSSLFHLHKTTSVRVGEFSASRLLRRSCGPRLPDQAAGFCWFAFARWASKTSSAGGSQFSITFGFEGNPFENSPEFMFWIRVIWPRIIFSCIMIDILLFMDVYFDK